MAIKDWPLPIRRAIGWSFVALAFAIAFTPLALIASAARSEEPLSWTRLLGGYALLVTVPTTIAISAFTALQLQRKKRTYFPVAVLAGTTIGLFVGLILGLVTGGYSILSAPATGLLTFVVAWAFQPSPAENKSDP